MSQGWGQPAVNRQQRNRKQSYKQWIQELSSSNRQPQEWKRSVFIPIPKKGNAKECSNCHTIALISNASKVMLKILQARLQQYMNREQPDVQAGIRKGRGTRNQIANIHRVIEKARVQKKPFTFALLTMPKPLTVWITTNCGKFLKRWEYQITLPASWEICIQVRKQQLGTGHGTTDWIQIRKGIWQGCILSPCLFKYIEYIMWYAEWMKQMNEWMDGWSTSYNQDCREKYQ